MRCLDIQTASFIIFIFKMMMHYSSVQPIKLKRKSTYHFPKSRGLHSKNHLCACSTILLLINPILFLYLIVEKWSQFVSCQFEVEVWLMADIKYEVDRMPKPYGKIQGNTAIYWNDQNRPKLTKLCHLNFHSNTFLLSLYRELRSS